VDEWLLWGCPAKKVRSEWEFDPEKLKIWLETKKIEIKRIRPQRPPIVLQRLHIGHWETETLSCRKSYQGVQVTVERKARYAKLAKLKTKSSRAMSVALTRRLSRYPTTLRRSIPYDNGPENAEHIRTNNILRTCSYFCEPFHSYERGTVENTIGLVRRFLPKKTNLAMISQDHLSKIESWPNYRPKKCLKFKTPAEVFKAEYCT